MIDVSLITNNLSVILVGAGAIVSPIIYHFYKNGEEKKKPKFKVTKYRKKFAQHTETNYRKKNDIKNKKLF